MTTPVSTLATPAAPPAPAPRRRSSGHAPTAATRTTLVALTGPALLWFLFFMIAPVITMFGVSLLDWPGLLIAPTYNGLGNYRGLLTDPEFWAAVRNTAVHVTVVLGVLLPTSFMAGYYLTLKPRGHRVLRVLFFVPALLSLSARAMVFFGVFAPGGVLNGLLTAVGLRAVTTPWLADPATALAVVIFIDLWGGIGFTAVLFAARLASVPPEIYEAAELDGAGHWRRMWSIAFPMIRDYVGVVLMLQFLWTLFYSATTVLLLTKGGPGTASTTLSYLVYEQAFIQSNIGYSQAVGVVLFVIGLLGMAVIRRTVRQSY